MIFAPSIRRQRLGEAPRPTVIKPASPPKPERAKTPAAKKAKPAKVNSYQEWRADRKPQTQITGWAQIRKRIIARDFAACRICREDLDRPEVHHIDYDRRNNVDDNLVTLCQDCHKAIHMERYKPSEHEDWPAPWAFSDTSRAEP